MFKNRKFIRSGLTLAVLLGAFGCAKKSTPENSEVLWFNSSSSDPIRVKDALTATLAFQVNLTTNRVTLFKKGVAIDQWNIASGDTSGAYHRGVSQFTPTGIFNVEDIQMCPSWYPRSPVNPETGRVVTSETERAAVFARNPSLYGACGANNPLGRYALWFNGAYGLHGNSNESILELPTAAQRRVSGGCVRNPNAKIKKTFHTVLDSFESLAAFSGTVAAHEAKGNSARTTLTKSVSGLDMKVIVGYWNVDPTFAPQDEGGVVEIKPIERPDVVTQPVAPELTTQPAEPKPTPAPTPAPTVTAPPAVPTNPEFVAGKKYCNIGSVDPEKNIAPVYASIPSPTASVSSFYRLAWPVTVYGEVKGTNFVKVNRGYLDKKHLVRCSAAE
jgi:hypothetical protein